ncbi:ABC transporter, partial [Streptomyces galilaeus]
LEEAEELADRIAVIDHGSLISLDTPERLIARHGKKRLHVTFAAAPVDRLPAGLAELGGTLDGNHLELPLPADHDLRALLA